MGKKLTLIKLTKEDVPLIVEMEKKPGLKELEPLKIIFSKDLI